jgi:hypothetical protein
MFVVHVVLLDVLLNDVLITEYGELLLQGGFLLLSDVKFNEGRVDVFHHFEQIEGEGDVNGWTVDEFVQ